MAHHNGKRGPRETQQTPNQTRLLVEVYRPFVKMKGNVEKGKGKQCAEPESVLQWRGSNCLSFGRRELNKNGSVSQLGRSVRLHCLVTSARR